MKNEEQLRKVRDTLLEERKNFEQQLKDAFINALSAEEQFIKKGEATKIMDLITRHRENVNLIIHQLQSTNADLSILDWILDITPYPAFDKIINK